MKFPKRVPVNEKNENIVPDIEVTQSMLDQKETFGFLTRKLTDDEIKQHQMEYLKLLEKEKEDLEEDEYEDDEDDEDYEDDEDNENDN
jgi:hypothetical protein